MKTASDLLTMASYLVTKSVICHGYNIERQKLFFFCQNSVRCKNKKSKWVLDEELPSPEYKAGSYILLSHWVSFRLKDNLAVVKTYEKVMTSWKLVCCELLKTDLPSWLLYFSWWKGICYLKAFSEVLFLCYFFEFVYCFHSVILCKFTCYVRKWCYFYYFASQQFIVLSSTMSGLTLPLPVMCSGKYGHEMCWYCYFHFNKVFLLKFNFL